MQRLGQGAFAGLVRSGDHGEARIELDRQVTVQAIVANASREEAHGRRWG